jgi:hypothetical protein
VQWNREWFENLPKFPPSFWSEKQNQKIFLEMVAKQYNVKKPAQWQRITPSTIKRNGGQVCTAFSMIND